jgi:hypothetical protein
VEELSAKWIGITNFGDIKANAALRPIAIGITKNKLLL